MAGKYGIRNTFQHSQKLQTLVKANAEYTEAGKTPVSWNFTTMPSENWKNGVGALLTVCTGHRHMG